MGAERLEVRAGQVIFEEGTPGTHIFVVEKGSVEVTKQAVPGPVVLTTLGPGAVFGEIAVLQAAPRSATVKAVEESVLVAIDSASLLARIASDPMFALQLMQRLAATIRRLTDQVAELTGKDPLDQAAASEYVPGYL